MTNEPSTATHLRTAPFVLASIVSAVLVLSAPFVGRIRGQVRTAFPGQFVTIVGGGIAIALGAAFILAIMRIREQRRLRYALLALSLAFGAAYSYAMRTGNPEVDAVEHFHFVEYGLVTLLFYRAWRPLDDGAVFVLPVLAALIVGALDEWFQWFIPVRVGELRDVFLNGAAIATGLIFSLGLDPPRRLSLTSGSDSRRRIRLVLAAAIVAFAGFVHIVHLGYDVRESERAFRSRYTAAELDALAADRATRWRANPPTELKRLSAEDQYMSEGLWHVQRRNRAWDTGDIATAFEENLILERFFAPVLDTPSYVSRTGHRWPPAQRADAEARARQPASTRAASYVSDAQLYPIFTWSRRAFWVFTAALAIVALAGVRKREPASLSGSQRTHRRAER